MSLNETPMVLDVKETLRMDHARLGYGKNSENSVCTKKLARRAMREKCLVIKGEKGTADFRPSTLYAPSRSSTMVVTTARPLRCHAVDMRRLHEEVKDDYMSS